MRRFILSAAILAATVFGSAARISDLVFTSLPDETVVDYKTDDAPEGELTARAGLPNFFAKVKAGKPVTVVFLGGSISQGQHCYRRQTARILESMYPGVDFTFVNAGVSGTGTQLGVFRLDDQVLDYDPDLVFVEFTCNGGYAPALEGIFRKIKAHNPDTDICLLHSASEKDIRQYQDGKTPATVVVEETLADAYGVPSVKMALVAADMEAQGALLWKGTEYEVGADEKVLFSTDGLHPVRSGGNLYAAAIGRALDSMKDAKTSPLTTLPEPLYGTDWDASAMYNPADVCKRHGLWVEVDAAKDGRFKAFADWFPKILVSSHAGSTLSFAFEGDMFGFFDFGGPEAGQLEIYVDGQMIRLKKEDEPGVSFYKATAMTGSHYLNRFNRFCDNRYRPQFELIKVEPGTHQVTIKLSDNKADKAKILGDKASEDFVNNPDRYDKTYLMLGGLLVRGKLAECNPVKGLPKMAQQLKWEKKINDYMDRDAEQSVLPDATLVVGSSSIDMWKSLETDFPGHNVIRRGVSGTKAIDLYNYRDQLIAPFNPKRIIIYEGDNEIGFKWTPDEMMEWMQKLFFEVRRMKPEAEIYLVSIKPSPVRAKRLDEIQAVNKRIREFVESQPRAGYIDIHTPMLNPDGTVRPELFLGDGLHPAEAGYDIWRREFGKVIK